MQSILPRRRSILPKRRFDCRFSLYRDYAKVFPGWKDPRINEELTLREYIFATYNEEIAKKYEKKPCANVPAKYFRDLSTIREQLKRDMGEI